MGKIETPSLNLPKGGGAVTGIGETFQPNAFTGTASLSIPVHTSPCRGFEPQLSVEYSSGSGNGIFGVGFSLAIPNISRKTDKGFPRYDDTDTFLISNADDLVPELVDAGMGDWKHAGHTDAGSGCSITRYRPRTEGLFARIERWTKGRDVHWRVTTKDNVTSIYGSKADARIADPKDGARVYKWLLEETFDAKGNRICYEYRSDDAHSLQEAGGSRERQLSANKHIHKVKYGCYRDTAGVERWHFEVIFDYGERVPGTPDEFAFETDNVCRPRQDPFSSFRAGFEIRTHRLCRGILLFHQFGDDTPFLVHGTWFNYKETPNLSLLKEVTQVGYREDNGCTMHKAMPPLEFVYSEPLHGTGFKPLTCNTIDNQHAPLHQGIDEFVDLYGEGIPGVLHNDGHNTVYYRPLGNGHYAAPNAPAHFPIDRNLESGQFTLLDLGGDGKLDLVAQASGGSGYFQSEPEQENWDPYRAFPAYPTDIFNQDRQMVDITGDGLTDLVMFEAATVKAYPSRGKEGFGPATVRPRNDDLPLSTNKSAVEHVGFADLIGDGGNHLVRIRSGSVECWPHLGYGNYGDKFSLENAPDFGGQLDPSRLFLTDIDGSGTTDLIYARHDSLEIYRCQSGNRLAEREVFPLPQGYDHLDRIRFADVLGNGTACLILTSRGPDLRLRHEYYDFNAAGKPHMLVGINNNMGAEKRIHYTASTRYYLDDRNAGYSWRTRLSFPVQVIASIEVIDDIAGSRLVTRYAYHDGYYDPKEREFRGFGYVEKWDTESFEDHQKWIEGHNSKNVSDVAEEIDEDYAAYVAPVYTRSWYHTGAGNKQKRISDYYRSHTQSDDHTGSARYYEGDSDDGHLPDSVTDAVSLSDNPGEETFNEVYRALHGRKLREEIYAWDNGNKENSAGDPYLVTESNFRIRLLQPLAGQRNAVCFVHPSEKITWQYERDPMDPRISHTMTLAIDDYGNVLRSVTVAYGRRNQDMELSAHDRATQDQSLATYTESLFTNPVASDAYHTPLPAETRTFELTGVTPENGGRYFSLDQLTRDDFDLLSSAVEIAYEQEAETAVPQKRLIEHIRTLYRPDDLGKVPKNDPSAMLPLGQLQGLALQGESYKLAFTTGLLESVFVRNGKALLGPGRACASTDLLSKQGGYVFGLDLLDTGLFPKSDPAGNWWLPSGRVFLSPDSGDDAEQELDHAQRHFFLPHRERGPFDAGETGAQSRVKYDPYDLLPVETKDALNNTVMSVNDYNVLQPRLVIDQNGNRRSVAYDPLGMVVASANMGGVDDNAGDVLAGFEPFLSLTDRQKFIADPHACAAKLLGECTTRTIYDLDRFKRTGQPLLIATLSRETHFHDPDGDRTKIQIGFSYLDGLGREIQKKIMAEPGMAPYRRTNKKVNAGGGPRGADINPGALIRDAAGQIKLKATKHRWVGSGRTVFNNKGKPVRQYESFFSSTHLYENEREMTESGVSSVLLYDPVGRVVATLHPNHTYEKTVVGPWRQDTWDENDTVKVSDPKDDPDVGLNFRRLPEAEYLPTWYDRRHNGQLGAEEMAAANKAAAHAETPEVTHFDALGRVILSVAENGRDDNGTVQRFTTRVTLDIEGNSREHTDTAGRIAMRYRYDALGNPIHEASMDAGERWMLNDAAGQPFCAWDDRGHTYRTEYDPLHRPLRSYVSNATTNEAENEWLVERLVYGEQHPDAKKYNLRGRLHIHLDQAGMAVNEAIDFKGNTLRSSRRVASEYKRALDWSAVDSVLPAKPTEYLDPVALEAAVAPLLDGETYTSSTRFDALNRPVQFIRPCSDRPNARTNVIEHIYNQASLLERVDVWLDRPSGPTGMLTPDVPFEPHIGIANIEYNARGQRLKVAYKNGTSTRYFFDSETHRLTSQYTRRGSVFDKDCENPDPPPATTDAPDTPPDGVRCGLQNIHYTYDPTGNVTYVRDDAQQTIYFANKVAQPGSEYTYDATYRLIGASGREQMARTAGRPHIQAIADSDRPGPGIGVNGGRFAPETDRVTGRYCETFAYDPNGNFLSIAHSGSDPDRPGWQRTYKYNEPSKLEAGRFNNRLSCTSVTGKKAAEETYLYDGHGNMTRMPHLGNVYPEPNMHWNFQDRLCCVDVDGGTVYYVYDSAGQRVRKILEKSDGSIEDRLYLGGLELLRDHDPDGAAPKREHETLHVEDHHSRFVLIESDITSGLDAARPLVRYQFGNDQNSVCLELDENAQIVSYEEYSAFGETAYQAQRTDEGWSKRYCYSGKERDAATGLYYYGARYYAPWLGRWTSPDPARIVDGLNLFEFVGNNPVVHVDNQGYCKTSRPAGYPIAPNQRPPDAVAMFLMGRIPHHPSVYSGNGRFAAPGGAGGVDGDTGETDKLVTPIMKGLSGMARAGKIAATGSGASRLLAKLGFEAAGTHLERGADVLSFGINLNDMRKGVKERDGYGTLSPSISGVGDLISLSGHFLKHHGFIAASGRYSVLSSQVKIVGGLATTLEGHKKDDLNLIGAGLAEVASNFSMLKSLKKGPKSPHFLGASLALAFAGGYLESRPDSEKHTFASLTAKITGRRPAAHDTGNDDTE